MRGRVSDASSGSAYSRNEEISTTTAPTSVAASRVHSRKGSAEVEAEASRPVVLSQKVAEDLEKMNGAHPFPLGRTFSQETETHSSF